MRILVAKICHFATSLSKALKKWKAVCIQITFDKFKVGFFKKYFQKNQARKKPTNFWNKKHPTRIFHGMAIGYIYRLRRYAAWQRLSACVGCRCSHPIRLCLSIGVNSSFIVENINTRKVGHTMGTGISNSYAVI